MSGKVTVVAVVQSSPIVQAKYIDISGNRAMLSTNLITVFLGAILPLLVAKTKKGNERDNFKLTDLSKILGILFVFEIISFGLDKIFALSTGKALSSRVAIAFSFYLFYKVLFTVIYFFGALKYSPVNKIAHFKSIIAIPDKETRLARNITAAAFITLLTVSVLIKMSYIPRATLQQYFFIMSSLLEDWRLVVILIPIEFISVVGEEIIYRYFAINAFKGRFSEKATIVITSVIWTLMHGTVSLEIFLAGILLGFVYSKTGSILMSILLHFVYNFVVLTSSFYVFYKEAGMIDLSSFQYATVVMVFQVLCFLIIEIVFKTTKRAGRGLP
jgi:hypothetical protein